MITVTVKHRGSKRTFVGNRVLLRFLDDLVIVYVDDDFKALFFTDNLISISLDGGEGEEE